MISPEQIIFTNSAVQPAGGPLSLNSWREDLFESLVLSNISIVILNGIMEYSEERNLIRRNYARDL